MSYVINLRLKDVPVLIVGGGRIAARKAKVLLQEGARITVLSPDFSEELQQMEISRIQKVFFEEALQGYSLVFAATDDNRVNQEVVRAARKRNLLVNDVSMKERSTFTNMVSKEYEGDLIALSSLGREPGRTAEKLEKLIEDKRI